MNNIKEQIKELNMKMLFLNLKKEQMTLRADRINESVVHYNGLKDIYGFPKSKEFNALVNWRENTYSKNGKVKKSSFLYKTFNKQEFSNRELAIAETFGQWMGTHVGQSWIQYKLKKKGYEEYGDVNIPEIKYLIPNDFQLKGKEWDFIEDLIIYFEEKTPKSFLNKNWIGLY